MTLPDLTIEKPARDAMAPPASTAWFFVVWFRIALMQLARLRYHFLFCLLSRPWGIWFTRFMAGKLRRIHAVPRIGKLAIPLRAKALRDMLDRTNDFNGAEAMCPRLPAGEVVLAIDWPRRHREERARLEEVLDCELVADDARIRETVRARCDSDLHGVTELHTVNLARLCENVALDVAERHLGVGVGNGPERDALRPIIRWLAARVFQGPVKGSCEETYAQIAADRMQSVVQCCYDRQARELSQRAAIGTPIPVHEMTVLQRMIALSRKELTPRVWPGLPHADWLDEDWIIRNITTLTVFGSVTSARAMTQAIPQLMKTRARWSLGKRIAAGYGAMSPATYDHATATVYERARIARHRRRLLRLAFEAMRFHPMLSMLGIRTALRDTVLSPETDEKTTVKAGAQVLPLLLGAMHDPESFRQPERFCPHRSRAEDHLHFGAGPHECVGRRMAEIQLEEITYALFNDPRVQKKPPKCGRVKYSGPAVTDLRFREC